MPDNQYKFYSEPLSSIRDRWSSFLVWLGDKLHREEPDLKSNKRQYAFLITSLLTIIFLSFFLKYPTHLLGFPVEDELLYRQLPYLIIQSNRIPWMNSPLSAFQMFPVSENVGLPLVVSSLAETVNTDVSYMVWPFTWIQTILGILGSFIAFHEFKKDVYFAVSGAAVFSLTTRYVFWTSHRFGLRGFFLSFLPFFFWALFRYNKDKEMKNLILMVVFGIIGLSIHRLGLFLIVIVIAYPVVYLIQRKIIPVYFSLKDKYTSFNLYVLAFSILLLVVAYILSFQLGLVKYKALARANPIFFLNTFANYFVTLGYAYAKMVGVLVPMVVFGFLFILFKSNKNSNEYFIFYTFLLFIPFAGVFLHVASFLMIILTIFIVYSLFILFNSLKLSKRKVIAIVLAVLILASSIAIFYTLESTFEERRTSRVLASDWENAGVYMRYSGTGSYDIIGDDQVLVERVKFFTGNARSPFSDMDKFEYQNAELRPLERLIRNPTHLYHLNHWYWRSRQYANPAFGNIRESSVEEPSVQDWLEASGTRYLHLNDRQESGARRSYERGNINLVSTTAQYRYKIYMNQHSAIYYM